jgi:hypothetical protein
VSQLLPESGRAQENSVEEVGKQLRRAIISSAFEVCLMPERAVDPIERRRYLILPSVCTEQRKYVELRRG